MNGSHGGSRNPTGRRLIPWGVATFIAVAAGASPAFGDTTRAASEVEAETVPDGVQMLMKRGGIPAIFDPTFVSGDEADIPDSAWVLGVSIGGEARAYSLNLLNGHEIVNDVVGGHPIAAVW